VVVSTCGRYSVVVCPVDIGATGVFLTEHSADIWVQEDRDEGVAEVNVSQSLLVLWKVCRVRMFYAS
jgi:hypothetical protein